MLPTLHARVFVRGYLWAVLDLVIQLVLDAIGKAILWPFERVGRRMGRWILGGGMEQAAGRAGRLWGRLRWSSISRSRSQ
jgi:hypothetical protein